MKNAFADIQRGFELVVPHGTSLQRWCGLQGPEAQRLNTYCIAHDLTGAFDFVPHAAILGGLKRLGIDGNILDVIIDSMVTASCAVHHQKTVLKLFAHCWAPTRIR